MPKYIIVTGGVMSAIGKGITAVSIAKLLQLSGFRVTYLKIDPYVNYDAGTMNPYQHGEVFVTDDGYEGDVDLGHGERFLDQNLSRENNITTGQVYLSVIQAERAGKYLGRTVQIIPHITDEIKARIKQLAEKQGVDVLVVECGGTVGDIESLPFLEAFRQMRLEEGSDNVVFVHVTPVPLSKDGEHKTKPTQHSVQELRRIGIQPDVIVARVRSELTADARSKISLFTNVDRRAVFSNVDVPSVYLVPKVLADQGLHTYLAQKLGFPPPSIVWGEWGELIHRIQSLSESIRIAMVGKYAALADSYISVNHSLEHAGIAVGAKVHIEWVDAETLETNPERLEALAGFDGILIPGGFGKRGSEGKILAADYARKRGIPFLGICFGFQMAVVAFARYVCGLEGANSTELDEHTTHPVIDLLPEQRSIKELGGTMRLGGHDIHILPNTLAHRIYGTTVIRQRHRHRYEVNPEYWPILERYGAKFSAFSDGGRRAEIFELPDHPFYLGTQFHAEFISRPTRPEPAYLGFVRAALERARQR
jgi:CTP synthase